jgi:hypothetical protein
MLRLHSELRVIREYFLCAKSVRLRIPFAGSDLYHGVCMYRLARTHNDWRNGIAPLIRVMQLSLIIPGALVLAAGLCIADLASGQPFGPEVTVSLSLIAGVGLLRRRALLYAAGATLMLIALLLAALWMLHPLAAASQARFEILCDSALLMIAACLITLGIDTWQKYRLPGNTTMCTPAIAKPVNAAVDVWRTVPAPSAPLVLAFDPAPPFLLSAQALPGALHSYVERHYRSNSAAPALTFNTLWDEPSLPLTHVNMLFQFALDALRERGAHTASGAIEVSIIATSDAAWVDIQDNGAHFAENDLALPVSLYRERAARLGGTLEIHSGDTQRNALRLRVAIPHA